MLFSFQCVPVLFPEQIILLADVVIQRRFAVSFCMFANDTFKADTFIVKPTIFLFLFRRDLGGLFFFRDLLAIYIIAAVKDLFKLYTSSTLLQLV